MRAPHVFTISPALPFLDTFVTAFLDGAIVPGVGLDAPLGLADATIYVPTRRSARALGQIFLERSGRRSIVPPRILPLGALEATETELIFAEPDPVSAGLPLPPAASPMWRRLRLAALIQTWAEAIKGALCSVDRSGAAVVDEREAFRVATSAVDAFALAGDLAGLIDEMLIENVHWRELDALRMAAFDDYWRITTSFLSIANAQWPSILEENDFVDPAARQIALVDQQVRKIEEGAAGPVLVIGSTGTNKATARLLAAIARAPDGAVVLPGLDLDLDDAAWAMISGHLEAGQEPSFGHPQTALARLLPILGVSRADVKPLGEPATALADRARFVAEALRPADTTDLWRDYRRKAPQKVIAAALADVSLIEAADEREEALCLAIAMREVLETPGRTAALVTPDRELARRVRGELLRWNVEVLDTGGAPLAESRLGLLARLVVAAAHMDAGAVTALLAHPLTTFGGSRAEVARLAALLEIGVLRVVPLAGKTADEVFTIARAAAVDRHAHPAQRAILAEDWTELEALWRTLREALAPLDQLVGDQPLDAWVEAHAAVIAAVTHDAAEDETDALARLFAELAPGGAPPLRFDAEAYGVFFGRVAGEIVLRNTDRPHPRLAIYGLLEARLMRADTMLLGGLDEAIWPPQATSDAFLNRPMRHDLGLSPPERRIGQTAHDFAQAMGQSSVVLSRARKRGGAPCVPSRFLLRLQALGGKAWEACRQRGAAVLDLAHALDRPKHAAVAIKRPRPAPPVALRPDRLSVTQIETLRRDPYSIYAAHVLQLAPLPRVGGEIDASEFGSLMHEALHAFVKKDAAAGSPEARHAALTAIVREMFAGALRDANFRAFRWPLILKAIEIFLRFDAKQRETTRDIVVETTGKLALTLADQSIFTLSARADRIDYHRDGAATLIDYKTGTPPGNREVQVGFAPQLTLEAAILRGGGFGAAHEGPVAATYLKLGGKDGGLERALKFDDETFAEVTVRHFDGLHRLLSSFRAEATSYPSRPFPKYAKDYGAFDHLARVREWSLTGEDDT